MLLGENEEWLIVNVHIQRLKFLRKRFYLSKIWSQISYSLFCSINCLISEYLFRLYLILPTTFNFGLWKRVLKYLWMHPLISLVFFLPFMYQFYLKKQGDWNAECLTQKWELNYYFGRQIFVFWGLDGVNIQTKNLICWVFLVHCCFLLFAENSSNHQSTEHAPKRFEDQQGLFWQN